MLSKCTVSFNRHELQASRLKHRLCPIKNCDAALTSVPYQPVRTGISPGGPVQGKTQRLPFCPVHGLRIHSNTFTYYNGPAPADRVTALRRNLIFNAGFYLDRIARGRLTPSDAPLSYESGTDALIWNVFTELARNKYALSELVSRITKKIYNKPADLYLWGGKIDLLRYTYRPYQLLLKLREHLESDLKEFPTEPDIMLVIPRKLVICIMAKFGNGNPIASGSKHLPDQRPQKVSELIQKYYLKNEYLKGEPIFDVTNPPAPFYEELFRNIVFAASLARLTRARDWYAVNLRSAHILNLNRGKPGHLPVTKNLRGFLMPQYRKQFIHLDWEDIYRKVVKDNLDLANLAWYLKTKSLNGARAFNIM